MDLKKKYGKVAVVMGGDSPEREISLISGEKVLNSLLKSGVDAYAFDPKIRPIHELVTDGVARAFLVTHGKRGEDGLLQGALEYLLIPYTNSGVMASALAMDKYRTKLIWQTFNIPMAKSQYVLREGFAYTKFKLEIDLPVVVKPTREGSTLGISKIYEMNQLEAAMNLAFVSDSSLLIEKMVIGDEFTITVCDGRVYPVIKIEAPEGQYDYQNKYFTDDTRYICPFDLGSLQQKIEKYAIDAYNAIGAHGVARIDFMMDDDQNVFFLEINTLPGMTSHSLVPMAFAAAGIDYERLCLLILDGATLGD